MRLLFIRHGDPDYENDDLTPAGKREAELLSERMVREDVSEYFVSPLGRAQATAAPTLMKTGRERPDPGDYDFCGVRACRHPAGIERPAEGRLVHPAAVL